MKYTPHQYQEYAAGRILDTPYLGLFLEMGLGKTVITLTAINELLYDSFEAEKVLVIAPLRVADDTWAREIQKWDHLEHLTYSKILGSAAQRKKALKKRADIYLINRENVEWLVNEYGSAWPFDTVILDESSSFKNPSAKRFRALRHVRPYMNRVVALTGTPASRNLMDLWSQLYLLDQGERLGKTVTGYRERYFQPGARNGHVVYEWNAKESAEPAIYKAIGDIVVSLKSEDWLNMPEKIVRDVRVKMNEEAERSYKRMERDLLLPFQDADVVAQTAAVLSNKLLQMASGAVYDENKGVKTIHDCKLDRLEDLIESTNGKPVMVMVYYKHSVDRILKRFPDARMLRKGKEGLQDIEDWNNDKIPILLLHPKSAGHGLNLQESSCQTVIWFDEIWALEEYQQANARIYRQGQKNSHIMILRMITEGTIDEDVIASLEGKAETQEALMQAVKARIEKVKEEENQ